MDGAWLRAGVASAQDWRMPLEIKPDALSWPDKHREFPQAIQSSQSVV